MFPKNPFNSPDDLVKAVTEIMTGKAKKEALDPVDAKALKGSHADRKDKDIDNDGDVDSSDKYLHNRRKAVKKAMNEAKVKENEDEDDMEDDDDEKTDAQKNDLDGDGKNDKKKKKKKDDELSGKPDKINTKPTLDDTRTMMAKEEVDLDEMSDAQMKKREEIVKSMKDKTADFKKRYGDRWKDVMYATATKQAMKEEMDEARGRPKKEDDVSSDSNFVMQLRKAISLNGNKVNFLDGSSSQVSSRDAQQFMTVYNKQKSSIDKGRLMKSAHKSLKHFKMALQGKIEKPKNPLDLD
jgi:hypothetical protein